MTLDRPRSLRIALAQLNATVGDVEGNADRMIEWVERAREAHADLVAFPELAVTGYPPEDLLLKPSFIRDNLLQLRRLAAAARGITVVAGFVDLDGDIYNAAGVLADGEVKGVYRKVYLPNYGVFDEERYFRRGTEAPVFQIAGASVGISICEDCWYPSGPIAAQVEAGAEVLVNINGSPFHAGKRLLRAQMLGTRASDSNAYFAWVNLVGGQDELVFDGNSMVFGPDGSLAVHGPSFEEGLVVADLDLGSVIGHRLRDTRVRRRIAGASTQGLATSTVRVSAPRVARNGVPVSPSSVPLEGVAEVYRALVVGTRDYLLKASPHQDVLLGLSGGIDSSLTAAIAVDALGPGRVTGVLMPSQYSSDHSIADAEALAEALGIRTLTIPIRPAYQVFEAMLAEAFAGTEPGLAEENIQARIRGLILMALSNKFGWLLLTTGNKSELATGYCTLYGDMAGGFAVLKDVPKTLVYDLSTYRNSVGPAVIPDHVLVKPPSAELRPDQKDEDSLPPYSALDPILEAYVEEDRSYEDLVAAGHDPDVVRRVVQLVDRSEYKRRQAPPGVKITPRAFGRDRRMPISNRYRS